MLDRALLVVAFLLAALLAGLIWAAGPIPHDTIPVSITKENHP